MGLSISLAFMLVLTIWATQIGNSHQGISTDPNDVAFYLYPNPNNLQDKDVLTYGDASSVANSRYDPAKALIVLIHGFAQNYTSTFPQVVKDAYLSNNFASSSNILVVDWGKLATPLPDAALPWSVSILNSTLNSALIILNYQSSMANVPIVAQRTQDFLLFLLNNAFLTNFDNTHLIGMSLGAHVTGLAGAGLQSGSGLTIARITGLDPAGPGYQGTDPATRLDASDAVYVDIVHTNQGEFGYLGSIGTADYYVNLGGPLQPGCANSLSVAATFCSHGKALYYYAQSIADSSLKGCKCLISGVICPGPCTAFGEYSPSSARSASGDYYLRLTISAGNA